MLTFPAGTYHTNGQVFNNKIDAILHKKSSNANDFYWNFNDEYFDSINWSVEPAESLAELYKQRALELRQKYDYLILHYTGGHDSHNILETFAFNDIHLDEVFMRGSVLSNLDSNIILPNQVNAELTHVALPIAKEIKEKYLPNLKITLIDHTQDTINFWEKAKNLHTYDTFIGDPSHYMRFDYSSISEEFKKLNDKGLKIAHITGHDKPYIEKDQKGYSASFSDDPFVRYYRSSNLLSDNHNNTTEFFYWHPDAVKITIKQCHVIVRYFEQIPNYQTSDLILLRKREDMIASLIYDRQYHIPIHLPKTGTWIVDPTTEWFIQDKTTTHYKNYAKHIWEWYRTIPTEFARQGDFLKYGLSSHMSKKHYIKVD